MLAADEGQLITLARRGDQEPMETLFRLHVQRAVRLAYLITRDWATHLAAFRDGSPFTPDCRRRKQPWTGNSP